MRGQRGFNLGGHYVLAIPQDRIDLEVRQFRRIILCGKHGAGFVRARPHNSKRGTAYRHRRESQTDPPPFHSKYLLTAKVKNSMPLLRHNRPDERRASRDTKIMSNL
jgi:hypothetical protein